MPAEDSSGLSDDGRVQLLMLNPFDADRGAFGGFGASGGVFRALGPSANCRPRSRAPMRPSSRPPNARSRSIKSAAGGRLRSVS
jgi:hypothetical protein